MTLITCLHRASLEFKTHVSPRVLLLRETDYVLGGKDAVVFATSQDRSDRLETEDVKNAVNRLKNEPGL